MKRKVDRLIPFKRKNYMAKKSRKRNYLEALGVFIILSFIIFIFDMPKVESFIIIGVVSLFNIFLYEVFGDHHEK